MSERKIESFEEFWPYYVGEHRSRLCRGLHYAGTSAAVLTFSAGVVTLNPLLMLLAPVLGYGPAWVGHFFVEHNKPASFDYPVWSFMSDFKMLWLALQGKMADEVVRLYGSAEPSPDAPLIVPM